VHRVDEVGVEELADDRRSPAEADVLALRRLPRLLERSMTVGPPQASEVIDRPRTGRPVGAVKVTLPAWTTV